MIVIIFFILALLIAVEAMTSISRRSGYTISSPSSGFIFQSSLTLISRFLVFMFMPLIGYLADTNNLLKSNLDILFLYIFIPLALIIVYFFRKKIERTFNLVLLRMEKYGTFFTKKEIHFHKQNNVRNNRKIKVLKNFYYVYAISYIPYYLAWPIVILLLSEYNDYRATIIGLTAIFNGVNTIILSVFIDPKLARLGQYNNIILNVYSNLLKLRIYASLFSFFALFLVVLLFDWK